MSGVRIKQAYERMNWRGIISVYSFVDFMASRSTNRSFVPRPRTEHFVAEMSAVRSIKPGNSLGTFLQTTR